MNVKEDLHRLVDQLADSELETARKILERLDVDLDEGLVFPEELLEIEEGSAQIDRENTSLSRKSSVNTARELHIVAPRRIVAETRGFLRNGRNCRRSPQKTRGPALQKQAKKLARLDRPTRDRIV